MVQYSALLPAPNRKLSNFVFIAKETNYIGAVNDYTKRYTIGFEKDDSDENELQTFEKDTFPESAEQIDKNAKVAPRKEDN